VRQASFGKDTHHREHKYIIVNLRDTLNRALDGVGIALRRNCINGLQEALLGADFVGAVWKNFASLGP